MLIHTVSSMLSTTHIRMYVPSYKTVIYNQDIASFKFALNGRQLSADALFAEPLLGN